MFTSDALCLQHKTFSPYNSLHISLILITQIFALSLSHGDIHESFIFSLHKLIVVTG